MIKALLLLLLFMVISRILLIASRMAVRRFGRNARPANVRGKNVVDGSYEVVNDDDPPE